jgi:divalent metal cation (Fe/Co/Zn/Cd) transporter
VAAGSKKTVLVAVGANATIAVVKGVAGAISGSAALLAEAAHSVADTSNQLLLLVSIGLGERPPDEEHPFGYGKERFWPAIGTASLGRRRGTPAPRSWSGCCSSASRSSSARTRRA